ncbi:unnamed protein product [Phaedon cochleariae]|nr:unnamed protein product [Phaedon cochleariae]
MLINNTLQDAFIEVAPINIPYLSKYFDFFSFGISLLLAVALAFGLKESSLANNIFTTVNVLVVLFVIIFGSIKADTANWYIQPTNSSNSTVIGKGGFFPFGIEGMIKGAATCFYGFVGFDCIATTGEEVKNPKKAIPISIILSLSIVFLAYFGTSTVVTLMVPYYLQNPDAPIPFAFEHIGWEWAKWIVSIGGIFGLCASLFGAMFPLPRIIYAMANDSLVFKFLGKVSPRFQTPVIGTLVAGLLTGLMAAIFDLKQLVNMMSIGTLLAYTIVAASVLLLRYSNEEVRLYMPVQTVSDSDDSDTYTDNREGFPNDVDQSYDESEPLRYESNSSSNVIRHIFNCGLNQQPTKISESIVAVEVFLYCFICLLICLCAKFWKDNILNGEIWAISLTSVTVLLAVLLMMSMVTQPTSKKQLSFKVPLVPLIPALSILINIYLMLMLDVNTWIRFGVWMALGIIIYYYSHRPYYEDAQIKNGKINGTEKHNGLYFSNNGFEDDTLKVTGTGETKKKRAPSPPRKSEDKTIEIQQELQKLDRMLDEVLDKSILERSVSISSVSVSDVPLREESVVADVHRDNVISFVEPDPSPSPPAFVAAPSPPVTPAASQIPLEESEDGKTNLQTSFEVSSPPDTPPTLQTSFEESEDEKDNPQTSPDGSEDEKTPPPSPIGSEEVVAPPPPPFPPPDVGKVVRLPRITAGNLQRTTLKSVEIRKKEKDAEFEPDDDNLRVGSNKTKSFMENLEGKLKKIRFSSPPYVNYEKKLVVPVEPTVEKKKNENVIEESIDKNEAKAKLGLFVNARLSGLGSPEKVRTSKSLIENVDVTSEGPIIEVETPVVGEPENNSEVVAEKNILNEDFMAHKGRMNTIFRSINLKSLESLKKPEFSRDVKTLGHKIDDKAKHRQAMNEIFRTIELRRTGSRKNSIV